MFSLTIVLEDQVSDFIHLDASYVQRTRAHAQRNGYSCVIRRLENHQGHEDAWVVVWVSRRCACCHSGAPEGRRAGIGEGCAY
jgi:hypothetical protein